MVVVPIQQAEPSSDPFEDAWLLYPRKVAKLAGRKAWAKVPAARHVQILTAIAAWRIVWRDKDEEYLPHFSTWINGERYEDQLPVAFRRQEVPERPKSVDQPLQARTPIPPHVSALLAKLRSK